MFTPESVVFLLGRGVGGWVGRWGLKANETRGTGGWNSLCRCFDLLVNVNSW